MARAGLTRDKVIDAAAALADAEGLPALTLARLAALLRVKSPSLYNHIDGLPGLLDELAMRAIAELDSLSRAEMKDLDGWDAIEALARVQRSYARSHPGLYQASLRSLSGRGERAEQIADHYLALVMTALSGLGLAGEDALHLIRCLRAAVSGFIALEAAGGFGMALDVEESFRRLLALLAPGMDRRRASRY